MTAARDTSGITDKRGVVAERITCPECGGSGLMTYPDVGDHCPCMTCSDGLYERGRGWIDTTAREFRDSVASTLGVGEALTISHAGKSATIRGERVDAETGEIIDGGGES